MPGTKPSVETFLHNAISSPHSQKQRVDSTWTVSSVFLPFLLWLAQTCSELTLVTHPGMSPNQQFWLETACKERDNLVISSFFWIRFLIPFSDTPWLQETAYSCSRNVILLKTIFICLGFLLVPWNNSQYERLTQLTCASESYLLFLCEGKGGRYMFLLFNVIKWDWRPEHVLSTACLWNLLRFAMFHI